MNLLDSARRPILDYELNQVQSFNDSTPFLWLRSFHLGVDEF